MIKLKNFKCHEIKKEIKLRPKTQTVMKFKNSICDENEKSNCDETQKLKL